MSRKKAILLYSLLEALLLLAVCMGTESRAQVSKELKNHKDSMSYALGQYNGESFFLNQYDFVDLDAFLAGFADGFKVQSAKIKDPERTKLLQEFSEKAQKRQQENQERESNFNRMVGKSIMEQNLKDDPTVKQTASGLQYKVLVEGTGARPTAKDRVKVHYTGTFYNGQIFDSSVQRGEPAEFGLNQVIKGWTEGLQLMTVGSKYKFWIPADLAYGNRQVGNNPKSAGSMLIFEVELLEINPK